MPALSAPLDSAVPTALARAVDLVGGQVALAAAIGLKQQNIWNWLNRGEGVAPADHCAAIERAADGKVRRWDLRPNDWWRIWPELIGANGAPAVPESTPATQGA